MIVIKPVRKCAECGTNETLVELDKKTFKEYDSLNYICENGHKHGVLIPKDCTVCRMEKDNIDLSKLEVIG